MDQTQELETMLALIEEVRVACAARLFTEKVNATWAEIGAALRAREESVSHDMWGTARNNLANFFYGSPHMPTDAEKIIEQMTGFKL